MRLVRFGTVELPNLDGEHSMPVTVRSATVELPNGSFDQDGGKAVLRPSTISCRAIIVGPNLDTLMDELLTEVSKGRRVLKATLRDDTTSRLALVKTVSITRDARAATYDCQQPIVMQLTMDYPFWTHEADGWFLDSGIALDDGYTLDGHIETFTVTSSPTTHTITNNGGTVVPAGTVYLAVRAASGITNPLFTNGANGMSFGYTGTLVAGDVLMFDFLTRTVTKNAVDVYNSFVIGAATQVDWMDLELGANLITVTGTGISGTIDVTWEWARHYL